MRHLSLPVNDYRSPSQLQFDEMVAFVDSTFAQGGATVVHCNAGMGRTGTMLAGYMIAKGMDAGQAIPLLRKARKGSIQTFKQEDGLKELEQRLRKLVPASASLSLPPEGKTASTEVPEEKATEDLSASAPSSSSSSPIQLKRVSPNGLTVVVVSDTHNLHDELDAPPAGLVHCGDFTNKGTMKELKAFDQWCAALPHTHKLGVGGNHDLSVFSELCAGGNAARILPSVTFLDNTGVQIAGVRFYGSGWSRKGSHTLPKPACHVLITHSPPWGILAGDYGNNSASQHLLV